MSGAKKSLRKSSILAGRSLPGLQETEPWKKKVTGTPDWYCEGNERTRNSEEKTAKNENGTNTHFVFLMDLESLALRFTCNL
jgi:hypothetical protein